MLIICLFMQKYQIPPIYRFSSMRITRISLMRVLNISEFWTATRTKQDIWTCYGTRSIIHCFPTISRKNKSSKNKSPFPLWLSLIHCWMCPNVLGPAPPLCVCLLHSELKQEESRINCILSCPLTDIAHSFPPMGDRWQRIAAIFEGTYCLSQCCLRERTVTPCTHTVTLTPSFWCLAF